MVTASAAKISDANQYATRIAAFSFGGTNGDEATYWQWCRAVGVPRFVPPIRGTKCPCRYDAAGRRFQRIRRGRGGTKRRVILELPMRHSGLVANRGKADNRPF